MATPLARSAARAVLVASLLALSPRAAEQHDGPCCPTGDTQPCSVPSDRRAAGGPRADRPPSGPRAPLAAVTIGSPVEPGSPSAWPGVGRAAASSCSAGNARFNRLSPYEVGLDFVPVTLDDRFGFHVVYSGRSNSSGSQIGFNVGLFLFPLDDGSVLLFGGGYGDPQGPGTALFDAAFDAANVASAVRDCLGRSPSTTPVHLVSPHWHGDHINAAILRALEAEGFPVLGVYIHEDDADDVTNSYPWTQDERARFVLLPDGPCATPIARAGSPLGSLWLTARSGHAAGAIDLVLDVLDNPDDRVLVQGSTWGTVCSTEPDGTRQRIPAHGNVLLSQAAQVVSYGSGVNPANTLVVAAGQPRPGTTVTLALDDPTSTVRAPALALFYGAFEPASGYPAGPLVRLPGAGRSYELLVDPLQSLATKSPDWAFWFGPGQPAQVNVPIPAGPETVGRAYFVQGVLVNPFAPGGEALLLSNGLELRGGT